ncbi:MAG: 1-deoxy-D-xylulose-5-phosphate synthase [Crocinitomicaceae bacterium]|nr:1-deoxy-D-xylulose-5-phosphate synthase [Crocinitomicaceae bacterium]
MQTPKKYLEQIDTPEDLRAKFSLEDLPQISTELRQFIIDVISEIGNSHFSASLGVIELTVALHFVYNTPIDQIIWDTGHQAYGHKILTDRRKIFHTNRIKGGISGFPKISESKYDAFGVGHSSTSISAALGMAIAENYKKNKDIHHIAVIGDGALSAGLAFEGLNNASIENDANLLIIINDNNMSIDPSVGALNKILNKLTNSKSDSKCNLFKELLYNYYGQINGNDAVEVATTLMKIKDIPGPKILHCTTKKGSGYKYSEEGNPPQWHAPGVFNKETGEIATKRDNFPLKYQTVFGETILELAQKNEQIIGITPAMASGSSLDKMMQLMPDRVFDVGIAEQHAITFSAGLAIKGLLPFCSIYSTFLQRGYDQLIHDVALQNLNVVFCIDRAGLVGADGATHHGVFDLAYLRIIPNMIVAAPMDEQELRNLLYTAQLKKHGPFAIRYPRGKGVINHPLSEFTKIEIGKGREITSGSDLALLTIGHVGNFAQTAIQQVQNSSIAHYDMRFVKPLDTELLHKVFSQHKKIITIEDGCTTGGFGSAIIEFMVEHNYNTQIIRLGVPDQFIHHGTQEELHEECHYDSNSIIETIHKILRN